MTSISVTKFYEAGSIGAMRCEKIVNAILSDIKGMPIEHRTPGVCKSYSMYNDADGWLDVTVYNKDKDRKAYSVMRRDHRRNKAMVLDVTLYADGRHVARTHTWDV